MKLCGFQASTGDNTADYFDGLKAIFCHKYDYQTQIEVEIFNSKGYNIQVNYANSLKLHSPTGSAPDYWPNEKLYLGQGDCDVDGDCYGDLTCGDRENGEFLQGINILNSAELNDDFCICPISSCFMPPEAT